MNARARCRDVGYWAGADINRTLENSAPGAIVHHALTLLPKLAKGWIVGFKTRMAVFEAAEMIADPTLVALFEPWTEPSEDAWLDQLAMNAMKACEGASPTS